MLPTILLASVAAALFGSADFMAGLASRRVSAVVVAALTYGAGLLVVGGVALASPPIRLVGSDLMWCILSSVTGIVGVVSLYGALGTGRLSIVSPLTAGLAAGGPALYDIAHGAHLRPMSVAGLVLAVVAVVVVSAGHSQRERTDMPVKAIGLAVLAGSSFAASIVALSLIGPSAGMAPLLMQRALGVLILAPAALVIVFGRGRAASPRPCRSTLALAVGAGLVDASATVARLAAVRLGPLAVAAVIGGLYPVSTILLAHFVIGERMTPREKAGVAMALAAVVLTALA